MKPKLKKWLIRSGVVCISLFIIGYCFRDFWFGQLRIYALGLAEVRSDEFGYQLPDVDTIEVIALDGYAPESVPALETALGYRVHGRAELRGEDAEKVAKLWRYLRRGRGFSAMCHSPAYVLRFHQNGKLLFETSVCWACHNYTLPLGVLGRMEYGFDSKREDAQALLELLQSHVPLPK